MWYCIILYIRAYRKISCTYIVQPKVIAAQLKNVQNRYHGFVKPIRRWVMRVSQYHVRLWSYELLKLKQS